MGMEMKLQVKMSQQLVMTPQLVQAIRLLQLSRLELVEEIRKELDGNPVLADDIDSPRRATTASGGPEPAQLDSLPERPAHDSDLNTRKADKQTKDVDWEQFLENRNQQQAVPSYKGGFEELPPIEQNLTKAQTLREYLLWQLHMSDLVENEKQFALLVIGNLDDRGYLDLKGDEHVPDTTLEDLAREAELDPEDAPDVLAMIQRFDPIGVAARDLRECMMIQAEVLGYDDIEKAIIRDHLGNVDRKSVV